LPRFADREGCAKLALAIVVRLADAVSRIGEAGALCITRPDVLR
jgi:hypothetical protein